MRRDLVLARVGRNSLHRTWIDRDRPRDWDLLLVPYESIAEQDPGDCAATDVIAGPKWSGLRELLSRWDGWRDYDHVWMPDDDLLAGHAAIDLMFDVARALELELFAPTLHEASHYAHFDTMVNRRFHARRVGFVEIMMPGFSRSALERLLPTLELSHTGWGWGLDALWPHLLEYRDVGLVDAAVVLHTRPVGRMRDADLARRVRAESDAIFARHGCRQVHATFEAHGPDLAPLPLTPEQLLAELASGYGYLIDRDPRVLAWLSEAQRPAAGWTDYPIEGTPDAGAIPTPVPAR